MGDPGSARRNPLNRPHLLVLALGVLGGALVAAWQARRTWFFGDDWAFLLDRQSLWGQHLFQPHNEHWSTLPRLTYAAMGSVFGIDHHMAYAMLPIFLHAAICVAVFILLRRHGVGAWASVTSTLLLGFLCGNTAENPLWVFQIGFLGSAFFGLVALLLADAMPRRWRGMALAWVAGVLALMSSGMAIPIIAYGALVLLLNRGLSVAVRFAAVPAVVYLVWYAAVGRDAAAPAAHGSVVDVLRFVHTGLAGLWQEVLRLPHFGGVFLLVLIVTALAMPTATSRSRRLAVAGVMACVGTYVVLGHSRAGLGTQAALASRYAYFGLIMTLPAFAVVLDGVITWLRPRLPLAVRAVLMVILAAVVAVSGTLQTVAFANERVSLAPGLEQRVLGARALVARQARLLDERVEPHYNPDITATILANPDIAHRLPAGPPTPLGMLDASSALQVAVSARPFGLPAPRSVTLHDLEGELPDQGCGSLRAGRDARVDIEPGAGGAEVSLTPNRDLLRTTLVANGLQSHERTDQVTRGTTTYIGNLSPATLRIRLRPGTVTLCR